MKRLLVIAWIVALLCVIGSFKQAWTDNHTSFSKSTARGSIAYVSWNEAEGAICVVNADGSKIRRLPNTAGAMSLNMQNSGQLIVFSSDSKEYHEREIFTVTTDGTQKRQLTSNSAAEIDPRFSSDGRKIVFVSERNNANEIYIMNADGSQQKRLTFHRSIKSSPCFSPDGKRVAFTAVTSYNNLLDIKILIINSDGTNLRRFGRSRDYLDPVWHPDGQSLLCDSDKDFVIFPVNGGKPKHLAVEGFSASWSLDGKHIVFNRLTDFFKKDGIRTISYNIFVMNSEGKEVRALVPNRRSDDTLFVNRWPTWGRQD